MTADLWEREFVLPADATLVRVADLAPRLRWQLPSIDDDRDTFALGRPYARVPSRLIGPQLAALVGEFRRPVALVDAVLRFSSAGGRDPFDTLDETFDALAQLIAGNILLPAETAAVADNAAGQDASCGVGQDVAGYEIIRVVRALADVEIYQAVSHDGGLVALKLGIGDECSDLVREAAVMTRLTGVPTARLIGFTRWRDRPLLIQSWCAGDDLVTAAGRVRGAGPGAARALAAGVLGAYAGLHRSGVLHGDIHPGNIVVAPDGSVSLIDFGRAVITGVIRSADSGVSTEVSSADGAPFARAGVAHFYEPEVARALQAGRTPPPVTAAGEQFAIAALVQLVLTGAHWTAMPPETAALMARIAGRPVDPFTRYGIPASPEVEGVIATALAKHSADRFHDVTAFAAAFRRASENTDRADGLAGQRRDRSADRSRFVAAAAEAVHAAAGDGSGTADLAWLALRMATTRDDPGLAATADLIIRADRSTSWWRARVDVAVAQARGDRTETAAAIERLVRSCRGAPESGDLLTGRPGALLTAAAVLTDLRGGPEDLSALATWAGTAAPSTLAAATGGCHGLVDGLLGMAHGVAGPLYAAVRVADVLQRPLDRRMTDLLAVWAETPDGVWPVVDGGTERRSGWCAGAPGAVLIWSAEFRRTGDQRCRALAGSAGEFVMARDPRPAHLCCGDTGIGFALLDLYRTTGDPRWLAESERRASRAIQHWQTLGTVGRWHDLRRGPLGTALLCVELERPEDVVLPPLLGG